MSDGKERSGEFRPFVLSRKIVVLSILYILLPASFSWASESIYIPLGSSDSSACAIIEKEHARGLELWRADRLTAAVGRFKSCEEALIKHALWMPPKLPEKPTADQFYKWNVTNSVIFSLASIYQKLGERSESERYAQMARQRGLLPRVFMSGRTPR